MCLERLFGDIMELNMFAMMYENGLIDKDLAIIPECPVCERQLVKTQDSYYVYYCHNCEAFFTRDLRRSKDNSKKSTHILKRGKK